MPHLELVQEAQSTQINRHELRRGDGETLQAGAARQVRQDGLADVAGAKHNIRGV